MGKIEIQIQATSRNVLMNHMRAVLEVFKKKRKKGTPILEVKCSCNRNYKYFFLKDIPKKSVICDCGRYIIKYGVIKDDNKFDNEMV